jgi:putative transposase
MRGFKSPKQAQRFLSAHVHIGNLFRTRHRHTTAADYRVVRRQAFETWKEATCAHSAA